MKRVLLLILLAITSFYLYRNNLFPPTMQKQEKNPEALTETYIKNIVAKKFNTDGKVKTRITSPYAEQKISSPMISLQAPKVLTFTANHNWQLTTNEGLYNTNREIFHAVGDVTVKQLDKFITLTTDNLYYNFKTDLIYTKDPVQIISKTGNIHATGMTADLNRETLELHQNIDTHYDPKKP